MTDPNSKMTQSIEVSRSVQLGHRTMISISNLAVFIETNSLAVIDQFQKFGTPGASPASQPAVRCSVLVDENRPASNANDTCSDFLCNGMRLISLGEGNFIAYDEQARYVAAFLSVNSIDHGVIEVLISTLIIPSSQAT